MHKGIRKGQEDRFGTPMGLGLGLQDVLAPGLELAGSSKPQRLASTIESETVSVVPQLAHLRPTSSVGDSIVDHCAPLMMKDAESQVWQAKRLCRITWRRHCARSPEGYMSADYTLLHSSGREGGGTK